jgi:hypothetical protein
MLWKGWGGNGFRKAESAGDGSAGGAAVEGVDPVTL